MVKEPKDAPVGAHFGAVLFGTRNQVDSYSGNSYYTVPDISYFAFPTQKDLAQWVLEATHDKKNYFFFEVKKLGQATPKVDIDLGL